MCKSSLIDAIFFSACFGLKPFNLNYEALNFSLQLCEGRYRTDGGTMKGFTLFMLGRIKNKWITDALSEILSTFVLAVISIFVYLKYERFIFFLF